MTVDAARRKLKTVRLKARKMREEINELRQIIWDAGADPDSEVDLMARNKEMNKRWMAGKSYTAIAKEFEKSSTFVSNVCVRIHYKLTKKKNGYKEYLHLRFFAAVNRFPPLLLNLLRIQLLHPEHP